MKSRKSFRRRARGHLITALMSRDGPRCQICAGKLDRSIAAGNAEAVTIDHRIPVSHGGTNKPENLRLAHARCNADRADAYDPEIDST